MTVDLIFHTQTAAALNTVLQRPPQSLLLAGPAGSGKASTAQWLVGQIVHTDPGKYPYLLNIEFEPGKTIPIEAVRQLEQFLSLKTPRPEAISRFVVINNAHSLSTEAQNALLKTLEEPPADTMLILTASHTDALLPTVLSRLQTLAILPPEAAKVTTLLQTQGVSDAAAKQIIALSGGLPGLATALAGDDQSHPLVAAAGTARQLFQASQFEKLTYVDKLAKDRQAADNVLQIMTQMAHAALLTGRGAERWQQVMQASYAAQQALRHNVQPKLALTNLMLNL